MAHESSEKSGVPYSGILIVVAAVAGIVVQKSEVESSRPVLARPAEMRSNWEQNVAARLWQDPMTAVKRHRENEQAEYLRKQLLEGQAYNSFRGTAAAQVRKSAVPDNAYDIRETLAPSIVKTVCGAREKVQVIAAMVQGGPSDEDAEIRRRTRYAVIAGLQQANAHAHNAEAIGYAYTAAAPEMRGLPETIPFEWFLNDEGAGTKQWTLVLWLDEGYFYDDPLNRVRTLIGGLSKHLTAERCNAKDRLKAFVLGPATSAGLAALKRALDAKPDAKSIDKALPGTEKLLFVSGSATMALTAIPDSENPIGEYLLDWPEHDASFFRLVGPDTRLIAALIDELKRHPGAAGERIVVINEQDTLYGQGLRALIEYARGENNLDVISYYYARGIDGRLLEPAGSSKPGKPASATHVGEPATATEKTSTGRHQVDYLRRMVTDLKRKLEQEPDKLAIKSFIVLGSDVYDKLLILRALKPEFPAALFMTTDLDARLLDPTENKWARNLIVAANYDLTLHDDLQRGVLPFRDDDQTAMYLATRIMAAGCMPELIKQYRNSATGPPWLKEALLFEIGRTEAVRLKSGTADSDFPDALPLNVNTCKTDHPSFVHPDREFRPVPVFKLFGWALAALFVILAVRWTSLQFHVPAWLHSIRAYPWTRLPHIRIEVPRWRNLVSNRRSILSAIKLRRRDVYLIIFGFLVAAFMYVKPVSILGAAFPYFGEAALNALSAIVILGSALLSAIITVVSIYLLSGFRDSRFGDAPAKRVCALALLFAGLCQPVRALQQASAQTMEPFAWFEGVSVWPTHLLSAAASAVAIWAFWNLAQMNRQSTTDIPERFAFSKERRQFSAEKAWFEYSDAVVFRVVKTILYSIAYIALDWVITAVSESSIPVRGTDNLLPIFAMMLYTLFLSLALLTTVAVSSSDFALGIVRKFRQIKLSFPAEALAGFRSTHALKDSASNQHFVENALAIDLIAQRSAVLNKFIYYPVVVSALMFVALTSVFDNWQMSVPELISRLLPLIVTIACIVWLRYETLEFHKKALHEMEIELIKLKGNQPESEAEIAQLEALLAHAAAEKRGSFERLAYQPLIRALVVPIGGLSGLQVFEHLVLPRTGP